MAAQRIYRGTGGKEIRVGVIVKWEGNIAIDYADSNGIHPKGQYGVAQCDGLGPWHSDNKRRRTIRWREVRKGKLHGMGRGEKPNGAGPSFDRAERAAKNKWLLMKTAGGVKNPLSQKREINRSRMGRTNLKQIASGETRKGNPIGVDEKDSFKARICKAAKGRIASKKKDPK